MRIKYKQNNNITEIVFMKNILLAITGLLLILVTSAGCSKETTEKIKQRRGAQIYLQKGEPVFDFGSIGDFYIDKNTGLLYGPKTVIGWGENPISLVDNERIGQSNTIHKGSGTPAKNRGNVGDLYLDISANPAKLYGPKTTEGWGNNFFILGDRSNLQNTDKEANYVLTDDGKTLAAWVNNRTLHIDMRTDSKLANITTIGEGAFRNSDYFATYIEYFIVKSIILPDNVEVIEKRAFQGLKYLETITLPKRLREIRRGLFTGCTNLKKVNIGNNVEVIEDFAFANTMLDELTLPGSIKLIGKNAFDKIKIKKLILPEGLRKIDSDAFADCKSLLWLEIPESLQVMGEYPFNRCGNVKTLVLHSKTIPAWASYYLSTFINAQIYVPDESLKLYQEDAWSFYIKDRLKPISELPKED
jgi:surface antigen bspA